MKSPVSLGRESVTDGYTNKGDNEKPLYRSRLVGMEFSTGAEPENFASTPPLEALDCAQRCSYIIWR